MTRHWVYWRSGISGDDLRIWATLLHDDGLYRTHRTIYPVEVQYAVVVRPDHWDRQRISKAEAERLAAAAQQKEVQP